VVVSKAPELKKRLKDLVRQRDDCTDAAAAAATATGAGSGAGGIQCKDRLTGEFAMDIGRTSLHQLIDVICSNLDLSHKCSGTVGLSLNTDTTCRQRLSSYNNTIIIINMIHTDV